MFIVFVLFFLLDALWEGEQAWRDQEARYESCDVINCKCPNGANYNEDYSQWEIYVCSTCGSWGCHRACNNIQIDNNDNYQFECPECTRSTQRNLDSSSDQISNQINNQIANISNIQITESNDQSSDDSDCQIIGEKLVNEQIDCQFDSENELSSENELNEITNGQLVNDDRK